ncbi:MAG: HK97 family phage prohead protease [Actinomycetota bacterium]
MPPKLETRKYPNALARVGIERRGGDDAPPVITGYGAVFYREGDPGTEYQLWSNCVERIMPGAFDRALREDDVRSFFNHDANLLLGRNRSGSLRLEVDDVGLRYEIDPPDTQTGRDLVVSLERGDVDGSSFMFVPDELVWRELEIDGRTLEVRELVSVQLWEVGPVVFPAYESSTSGLRGEERHAEARSGWEAWKRDATPAFDRERIARRTAMGVRLREVEQDEPRG